MPRNVVREAPSEAIGRSGLRYTGSIVLTWCRAFGFDPVRFGKAWIGLWPYLRNVRRLRRGSGHVAPMVLRPHLADRSQAAGSAEGHYFWQDMLVAQRIFSAGPKRHIDVGSRVDGFVSHLLTFRTVDVVDIRPLPHAVPGLTFVLDDATSLASIPDKSVESLSSLHAVEHFGLGRYGDAIDAEGHVRGMKALQRVLAPGGRLYLAFPVGAPVVEYNSQRVLHPNLALDVLDELRLARFVAIPSHGGPRDDVVPAQLEGTHGWCGLYEFVRP